MAARVFEGQRHGRRLNQSDIVAIPSNVSRRLKLARADNYNGTRPVQSAIVDANREQAESVGWAEIIAPLKSSMPIRPEYKWFYPIDWPQLSAVIRFERAKGRCERCGRPHGRKVQHLGDGRWWDEDERTWRNACGRRLARRVGGDIAVRTTTVFWPLPTLTMTPPITGCEI